METWVHFLHPPREDFAATMTEAPDEATARAFLEGDPVISEGFARGELRPMRISLLLRPPSGPPAPAPAGRILGLPYHRTEVYMRFRASRARVLLLAVLVPALVASVAGCGDVAIAPEPTQVPGAGEVVTETRDVGSIERISIAAPISVVVRTGEPGSVTVSAQENILPLVVTEVRDGQLVVNVPSPGYTTTEPVTLTVIAPVIASVTVSGGATGMLEVVGDALRVDLSGEAELDGLGRVGDLTLTMSSDARAAFAELIVGSAVVALSGGAAAELAVAGSLTGDASEGATITLASQPSTVDVTVSSGGSVQGGASPAP